MQTVLKSWSVKNAVVSMFYVVRVHLECLLLGVHAAHGEDLDQGHGGARHDKLRSHEEQQPVSTGG